MANTAPIAANIQDVIQKELYKDVMDDNFFSTSGMMSTSENSVVQRLTDLQKTRGDRVTLPFATKMSGDGVAGTGELEGQEEAIDSFSDSVLIDYIKNAARLRSDLDEQKTAYDIWMDAKNKSSLWMKEFLERQIFMKAGGVTETDLTDVGGTVYSGRSTWSNSPNPVPAADEASGSGERYLCADSAGLDSLQDTDIFVTSLITKAKVKAEVLGQSKLKKIRVKGREYYLMFIHPWQSSDLKTDSNSNWAQAQRDAQSRGDDNPIFTGALGIWDGVILYDHEYVPTCQSSANFSGSGTAAGARAFRSVLLGAQAVVMAEAKNPLRMVEETFNYKEQKGVAVKFMGGFQKPTFNSKDYAVISVDTGATDLS